MKKFHFKYLGKKYRVVFEEDGGIRSVYVQVHLLQPWKRVAESKWKELEIPLAEVLHAKEKETA